MLLFGVMGCDGHSIDLALLAVLLHLVHQLPLPQVQRTHPTIPKHQRVSEEYAHHYQINSHCSG